MIELIDLISVVAIAVLSVVFYVLLNNKSDYWKKQKVPYIKPIPVLGNLKSLLLLDKSVGDFLGDLYNSVEASNQRFVGIHLLNCQPALLVRDPDLVKSILVSDFHHFTNRAVFCDEKNDPIGYHNLFVVGGSEWKFLRTKLTSTFTSSKIKIMFPMMRQVMNDLLQLLEQKMEKNNFEDKEGAVLETKSFVAKFTTDLISLCAFSIKSNCIFDDNSSFTEFSSNMFRMSIKRALDIRFFFFVQPMVKVFKSVFMTKKSTNFFKDVFQDAMKERNKQEKPGNDFLDLLLKLKKDQEERLENGTGDSDDEKYGLKGDLLLAQSILFFTAGFETSSTVISLCLYELALQPHIQDKLREEILECTKSSGGQLTYEDLSEMEYLSQVISETLRKYPPMTFIERKCTKDYEIPDSKVVVKKGTLVYIPLYKGLHYDPKYFPMPEKFDPDRFSKENKNDRHLFSYLPFGEGPRNCLGKRFGLTSTKFGICGILSKYEVKICEKSQVPLVPDNRGFLIASKEGIYLKFVKI